MGWRKLMGLEDGPLAPESSPNNPPHENRRGDTPSTHTEHTKLPQTDDQAPKSQCSVCIVGDIQVSDTENTKGGNELEDASNTHTKHTELPEAIDPMPKPTPFQTGETVRYQTPVIKSPTDYSWAWHQGTVKEIREPLEMAIITPSDTPQRLISIPFVHVRPYEQNEINELMEAGEHGQEGR